MSNELMLDVGQANELKLAFRRAKFSNADIKRMCQGDVLENVREYLRGYASITKLEHIIDCDADPLNPLVDGHWSVFKHQKCNKWKWNLSRVTLCPMVVQKGGEHIEFNKLHEELVEKPLLNANVLDYLLFNPVLIPEEWKRDDQGNTLCICFWGTIYRHDSGRFLCVRFLYWDRKDNTWRQNHVTFDPLERYSNYLSNYFAAMRTT